MDIRENGHRASLRAADVLLTSALFGSCAFIAWVIVAH